MANPNFNTYEKPFFLLHSKINYMKYQPQKHFTVESYEQDGTEITVMLEKYNAGIPVTIPQDKFEWWLRLEDKLDWCIDTNDHQGEHQQFYGTMFLDEYWNTDKHAIQDDLYEYVISHPIKWNGVEFTHSLDSLLLAFDIHNAQRALPHRWEHEQEILNELIN